MPQPNVPEFEHDHVDAEPHELADAMALLRGREFELTVAAPTTPIIGEAQVNVLTVLEADRQNGWTTD